MNSFRVRQSYEKIIKALGVPGALILDVFIDDAEINQWQKFHEDYSDAELSHWQILESLRLVRMDYRKFRRQDVEYRIRTATITSLGVDFYSSCHDGGLLNCMSEDVRFTRRHRFERKPAAG